MSGFDYILFDKDDEVLIRVDAQCIMSIDPTKVVKELIDYFVKEDVVEHFAYVTRFVKGGWVLTLYELVDNDIHGEALMSVHADTLRSTLNHPGKILGELVAAYMGRKDALIWYGVQQRNSGEGESDAKKRKK